MGDSLTVALILISGEFAINGSNMHIFNEYIDFGFTRLYKPYFFCF